LLRKPHNDGGGRCSAVSGRFPLSFRGAKQHDDPLPLQQLRTASALPEGVRIAPQGHFFALRAQGATPMYHRLTMTAVIDALLHPSNFPRHREERSDVTIRFPCGSYLPHRHYLKEYGLHPKGTSSRYALRASRLAAQASQ